MTDVDVFEWARQFSGECPGHEWVYELERPPPKRGPWYIPEVKRCRICDETHTTAICVSSC